jgi:Hemerythrin HHE cation binding domain
MAAKKRPNKAGAAGSRGVDAVSLLKADHRQVEQWFKQFENASDQRKATLARQICQALRVHTAIEEEIFYPAFLEQAKDEDLHHEAEVEHAGAKNLIAQIEKGTPEDEYFDAKVTVLSEMIKHHVREEEQPGGMFSEARKANMDLKALGEELQERKAQLEQGLKQGRVVVSSDGRALDSTVLTA